MGRIQKRSSLEYETFVCILALDECPTKAVLYQNYVSCAGTNSEQKHSKFYDRTYLLHIWLLLYFVVGQKINFHEVFVLVLALRDKTI
jgi:hypothetical protein